MSIDSIRLYQISGQVILLSTAKLNANTGVDQQIIAGTTGSFIRVMGYEMQNVGTVDATCFFKTASAGAAITRTIYMHPFDIVYKPVIDSGYTSTHIGEGLFCDITGDSVNLEVYFLTYKQ